MINILMVCLGNICRSPLAEGILRSKLTSDKYFIDSAGTAGYHIGKQPDLRSIKVAKKHSIDISNQKCRQFSTSDFDTFDYIYVMDMSNYKDIIALAPNEAAKQKVQLILNELFPNENVEVPDPYYVGDEGFEQVFQMLDKSCDVIVQKIKHKS
uniref:low molecular weight protein-tyrosine-phosphatase n=1 Tax=Flavobacterium sp. TaxID=239 RepID=UPI00404A9C3D